MISRLFPFVSSLVVLIGRYGMVWVDFLRILFFAPRFFCVFFFSVFFVFFSSCFVFFAFAFFCFLFRAANCGGGDIIITRGRLILEMMRCACIFFVHQAACMYVY